MSPWVYKPIDLLTYRLIDPLKGYIKNVDD